MNIYNKTIENIDVEINKIKHEREALLNKLIGLEEAKKMLIQEMSKSA